MTGDSSHADYCCPACRGPLVSAPGAHRCPGCRRSYPIVCGIPDFRLAPDPYIGFADEYEKVRRLSEAAEERSFEALVRFYWEITPDVPRPMAERFIRHSLTGEERAQPCLAFMDAQASGRWIGDRCLDIGSGTGGFLAAARDRFTLLVGADVALRWLVVARKRLAGTADNVLLVCCSAERLPFRDRTFDGVVAIHALEHAAEPQAVVSETFRTLRPNGFYYFSTPNRFSLGPEPSVHVWGVGFLPRSLAGPYVRWVRGVPYRHIKLLSSLQLRRLCLRSGLPPATMSATALSASEQRTLPRWAQGLVRAYHAIRELPILRHLFLAVGPLVQIAGRKAPS